MKELISSNNITIKIDDEDYLFLNQWKWHVNKIIGYAMRGVPYKGKMKTVTMHELLMETAHGQYVDHINRDRLDNRKSNLRVCTQAENLRNQGLSKNNKTGVKGVSVFGDKFRAMIMVDGKSKHLGVFKSVPEAARAYSEAEERYY